MTTDTTFCGTPQPHRAHTWPTDARHPDDTFTCDGRPATTHPVTLRRVYVAGLGNRWQIVCTRCGPLLTDKRKPYIDRESAEYLARAHEAAK